MAAKPENTVRLQKFLSSAGVASRRTAERLIAEGKVRVNGKAVTEMGVKVDPETDRVTVEGQRITVPSRKRTYMIYKPRSIMCTRHDPEGRPTVYGLLDADAARGVHSVGRLDYDAEGLLLLTNDGDLTAALTHPRGHVAKVYLVKVKGCPSPASLHRLREGVTLEDGRTLPAEADLVRTEGDPANHWLRISLREGRKNQIKRMGEAIGHPVLRIIRTQVGSLKLPDSMRPGQFRLLRPHEMEALLKAAGQEKEREGPDSGSSVAPSLTAALSLKSNGRKAVGRRAGRPWFPKKS